MLKLSPCTRRARVAARAAAALVLPLALVLTVGGCAATQVVTGTPRPPIAPEEVRIYTERPPGAVEIAILDASSRGSFQLTDQAKLDATLARLRKAAARLGANGVWLESTSRSYSGSVGTGGGVGSVGGGGGFGVGTGISVPLSMQTARGRAIYVPPASAAAPAPPARPDRPPP